MNRIQCAEICLENYLLCFLQYYGIHFNEFPISVVGSHPAKDVAKLFCSQFAKSSSSR